MEDFGHLATFHPDPVADRLGYVVAPVDKATGKVVGGSGLAGFVARAIRPLTFALIRVDETIRIDDIQHPVDVFRTRETTNVKLRARVRAPRAMAEAAAEALYDPLRPPSAVFADALGRAISSRFEADPAQGPETLVERLAEGKERWEREIAAEVGDKLALEVEIAFDIPSWIEARITWRERVVVTPKDAPHAPVPLTVSLTLERRAGPVTSRPPRGDKEEALLLRTLTERVVRDHVHLYDYWFEKADMESVMRVELDELLRPYGRRVATLLTDPVEAPVSREEHVDVECEWKGRVGRSVTFHVEANFVLRRDGAGLYDGAGREDRKAWLEREAAAALRSAMYAVDVFDLTPTKEKEVMRLVEDILRERASRIGHDLQSFVAAPRLAERAYLRLRAVPVGSGRYRMRHSPVEAEFSVDLRVRLKDLRPFADLWGGERTGSNVDLVAELDERLSEQAKAAAARTMAQTTAEDYFLKFEPWEAQDGDQDGPFVRDRLETAIRTEVQRICPDADVEITINREDKRALDAIREARRIGVLKIGPIAVVPGDADGDQDAIDATFWFDVRGFDVRRLPDALTALGDRPMDLDDFRERMVVDLETWCREVLHRRPRVEIETLNQLDASLSVALDSKTDKRMRNHYGIMTKLKGVQIERSLIEDVAMRGKALPFRDARARIEAIEFHYGQASVEANASLESLRQRATNIRGALEANAGDTPEKRTQRAEDEAALAAVEAKIGAARRALPSLAGSAASAGALGGGGSSTASGQSPPDSPEPGAVAPGHPDGDI